MNAMQSSSVSVTVAIERAILRCAPVRFFLVRRACVRSGSGPRPIVISHKPTPSSLRRLHHCCMGVAIVLPAASNRSDSESVSRCQKGLAEQ